MQSSPIERLVLRILPLLLLGLIIIAGAQLRLDRIWLNQMTYDEGIWGNVARTFAETGLPIRNLSGQPIFFEHPPLWWMMTGAGISLFGPHKFGYRFFAILLSILVIPLMYLTIREINGRCCLSGHIGALSGAFLAAMSPAFIYLTRTDHIEIGTVFFGTLTLFLTACGLRRRHVSLMLLAGVSSVLAVMVKFHGLLYLVVVMSILAMAAPSRRHAKAEAAWLLAGILAGTAGFMALLRYIYGNIGAFFEHSIAIPVAHVLRSDADVAVWRTMAVKDFLDTVYGWFHPVPLLFMAVCLVLLIETAWSWSRRRRCHIGTESRTPCIIGLWAFLWLSFLTIFSATSRSIPYSSLALPLLIIPVGWYLQRLALAVAAWQENPTGYTDTPHDSPRTQRPASTFPIISLAVHRFTPGILLVLLPLFLCSGYTFGERMIRKEKRKNLAVTDQTEVIGHFLANRFPWKKSFVSSTHGPQISFYSGFRYEITYDVEDVDAFTHKLRGAEIFVYYGRMWKLHESAEVDKFLQTGFRKDMVTPYIACFSRSPQH